MEGLLIDKSKNFEFKGYDWYELAECWGIYDPEEEDEVTERKIKDYLVEHSNNPSEIAGDIREFLKKLYEESKKIDYNYPVWKALLELEDDWTLLHFTHTLLTHMWT